jgi:hypothetical protein
MFQIQNDYAANSSLPARVVAEHPSEGRASAVAVSGTTLESPLVLEFPSPVAFRGRVIRSDETPVPGALVRVRRLAEVWFERAVEEAYRLCDEVAVTRSDQSGWIRVRPLPRGSYVFEVSEPSLGLSVSQADVSDPAEPIDLVLEPLDPIEGTVRDELGSPVPGAEVFTTFCSPREYAGDFRSLLVIASGVTSARSDAEGRFWLPRVGGAEMIVGCRKDGFLLEYREGVPPGASIEFRLPRAGGIRGRVVDRETSWPVDHGRVVLSMEDSPSGRPRSIGQGDLGASEGQFYFGGLPAGRFDLVVESHGFERSEHSFSVEAGETYVLEVQAARAKDRVAPEGE